jgi:hypothetical protein
MGSSVSKIAHGIARSVTFLLSGFFEIINLTFRPLSLTISAPRNSDNRLAQVMLVDF